MCSHTYACVFVRIHIHTSLCACQTYVPQVLRPCPVHILETDTGTYLEEGPYTRSEIHFQLSVCVLMHTQMHECVRMHASKSLASHPARYKEAYPIASLDSLSPLELSFRLMLTVTVDPKPCMHMTRSACIISLRMHT